MKNYPLIWKCFAVGVVSCSLEPVSFQRLHKIQRKHLSHLKRGIGVCWWDRTWQLFKNPGCY